MDGFSPQIIISVVHHVVNVEIKILDYVCNERLRVEIWSRPNLGSGQILESPDSQMNTNLEIRTKYSLSILNSRTSPKRTVFEKMYVFVKTGRPGPFGLGYKNIRA